MYNPPDQKTAFRLLDEITSLLVKSGGFYKNGINRHAETTIVLCIATGQFFYRKGAYFVCWFYWDEKILHELPDNALPHYDITKGIHTRVEECGVIDHRYMPEIRRKIRTRTHTGVSWYREKTGRQVIYMHQKESDMGGSASGGTSTSESASKPLTAEERSDIFKGGIADIASYAPQYFTPTSAGYTMDGPGYQAPTYVPPGAAQETAITPVGTVSSSGPAAQATNSDAGAFNRIGLMDPGAAKQLAGGDYEALQNSILQSRLAPLGQAMAAQYQMTDQEMADRGIYTSGIGAQAKEKIFSRDYLPQINQAAADSVTQRYGLESGDNNATNSYNLSNAQGQNSLNMQQNLALNQYNSDAAARANAISLANSAATNQNNQFNASAANGFALDTANASNAVNLANTAANNQYNLTTAAMQQAAAEKAAQTQYDSAWRPLDYAAGIWNGTGGQVSSSSGNSWNAAAGFTI